MIYAKLINENEIEELNPSYIKVNGNIYTNPLNSPFINIYELGYKELIVDDMPSYDENSQKVVRYYQIIDNKIHRSWRVENLTAEEIQAKIENRQN